MAPPDSVAVRVRSEFDLHGVDIHVPVVRPALTLAASPERIQGFWLESATLTVRAVGIAGAESLVVSLTSDLSAPEPVEVRLNAAVTGSSAIRSAGLGPATVSAERPPLVPGQAVVSFRFPWAFLTSAALGGLVGSIARQWWLASRRHEPSSAGRRVTGIVAGTLIGCIVAVLYAAVGINVFDIEPAAKRGEAVVFAFSALGAVGGLAVPKKLMPLPAAKPPSGPPHD